MPRISPHNHKLTKQVNTSLKVSVSYEQDLSFPDKFQCVVEFVNAHPKDTPDTEQSLKDDINEGRSQENSEINDVTSKGWFSSLWSSESTNLIKSKAPEVPLLLGYIQMVGYVRLNHQIGVDSGSENSQGVYWKNHEYSNTYCDVDCDDKVQQILRTELFQNESIYDKEETSQKTPRLWNMGGISDLNATSFDPTAHYLLHDLTHSFGTMEMPNNRSHTGKGSSSAIQLDSHLQNELSTSLKKFIVPFYVTAQHLLFSSDTLLPAQAKTFKFRIDVPSETLPPSYNTKSTGSVGEAGLASIVYSFVVGFQEDVKGEMKHRAVYFPIEIRPGQHGPDRTWFQHDYLQKPLLDKEWSPEILYLDKERERNGFKSRDTENSSPQNSPSDQNTEVREKDYFAKEKTFEDGYSVKSTPEKLAISKELTTLNTQQAKAKTSFLKELDTLIEGSLEALAAKERRKSSVGFLSPGDCGLLSQISEKPRLSYQVRINDQSLCLLLFSNSTYHIGDDVHFSIKLHPDFRTHSRVVGLSTHIEAHEIFHLPETHKLVNIYKVTPTLKINTYADALMFPFASDEVKAQAKTGGFINLPRFMTQQFQASKFMDLRYFMVFRFVLNEFPEMESFMIDEDTKTFTEYVSAYKLENEANEIKFSVPLTVLP